MICEALLYYFNRENRERGEYPHKIIFETDNQKTAVQDAVRWQKDRKENVPSEFSGLVCVKIADFPIGRIQEDGSLRTGLCWPFYEWKADHPGSNPWEAVA